MKKEYEFGRSSGNGESEYGLIIGGILYAAFKKDIGSFDTDSSRLGRVRRFEEEIQIGEFLELIVDFQNEAYLANVKKGRKLYAESIIKYNYNETIDLLTDVKNGLPDCNKTVQGILSIYLLGRLNNHVFRHAELNAKYFYVRLLEEKDKEEEMFVEFDMPIKSSIAHSLLELYSNKLGLQKDQVFKKCVSIFEKNHNSSRNECLDYVVNNIKHYVEVPK